jgi:hypothetical protein
MNQFQVSARECSASQSVTCVSAAAVQAYAVVSTQVSLVTNNVFFPSDAQSQAVRYETSLDTLEAQLLQLETSTSYPFDVGIINNSLPKSLNASTAAYQALNLQLHR